MKVAEFYALFSVKPDLKSLQETNGMFRQFRYSLLSLGALFGGAGLIKGLVGFNMRVEDAKTNIASMLALAGKTTVVSQLENANQLYENLRRRASELPGTTEEYVAAMSRLTFPIMSAGLGLKDLEDMTVNAIVAAKGLGHGVKAAMTDVVQGIEGRFSTNDFFLKNILEPLGYTGKEGRDRFKGLSKKKRALELQRGLTQPAILESAQRQSQNFSGQLDKIKEQTAQFLGRVGLPLFNALGNAISRANTFLEAHRADVQKVADTIGGVLVKAFGTLGDVFAFFTSGSEESKAILWGLVGVVTIFAGRLALAWLAALGPMGRVVGIISLAVYLFNKLKNSIGEVGAVVVSVFGVLAVARIMTMVGAVRNLTFAMLGLQTASKGAAVANGVTTLMSGAGTMSAAGAAINSGALGFGLGPAGAAATRGGGGLFASLMGGGAAGAMEALPMIAVALGAAYALSELTGGAMDLKKAMDDVRQAEIDKRYEAAKDAGVTVTIGDTNVHVAGMMSGETLAEFKRVIEEEAENQLRHIQQALTGGTR